MPMTETQQNTNTNSCIQCASVSRLVQVQMADDRWRRQATRDQRDRDAPAGGARRIGGATQRCIGQVPKLGNALLITEKTAAGK